MPAKKYKVILTEDETEKLKEILRKRKQNTQTQKRARALLLVDEGCTDEVTGEQTGMSRRGLEQLRKRFVEEGFEATVTGKPKGHRPKSLREKDEARLVALVRGPKPEGKNRWTLRLLAKTWETLAHTETKTISYETIRKILKKAKLSLAETGNSPPEQNIR
jgi:transposase